MFLLCWLQAVLTQRLRFTPLAFTKIYEFNDADFSAGLNRIQAWVEDASKGKANMSPSSMPWTALRSALTQYAFGGQIDSDQDQSALDSFVSHLFSEQAYDLNFPLSLSASIKAPDGTTIASFIEWTLNLPDVEDPTLLGLPTSASKVIAANEGELIQAIIRVIEF